MRRVVTGENGAGKSIVLADTARPREFDFSSDGPRFYEMWASDAMPVPLEPGAGEPVEAAWQMIPAPRGTKFRIVDVFPETPETIARALEALRVYSHLESNGSQAAGPLRHPLMHRTDTLDYGIVLSGEIYLIMEEGETLLQAGDVIIQRGTNHAWSNRSQSVCRMAFVLIDALAPAT